MTGSPVYVLSFDDVGEDAITVTFNRILDLLRHELSRASIDVVTDLPELDEPAAEAMRQLLQIANERQPNVEQRPRRRGRRRSRPDPAIAVGLDLQNDDHMRLLRQFGPYSINAVVFGGDPEQPLVAVDDSGSSLLIRASDEVVDSLVEDVRLPRSAFQRVAAWRESHP